MNRFILALAALLSLAVGPTPSFASADPAQGYWLTQNGKAIVKMQSCGAQICGRTVWVANPRDDAGALKRDVKNADDAKRGRPICGLQLVGGLTPRSEGDWKGGWIYNPRDGETYSVDISALSAERLKVRGYVGVSLLGKSQTWTRVADDRGGC